MYELMAKKDNNSIETSQNLRQLPVIQKENLGASLKDLGKKWFAFSLMENLSPSDLIGRLV